MKGGSGKNYQIILREKNKNYGEMKWKLVLVLLYYWLS